MSDKWEDKKSSKSNSSITNVPKSVKQITRDKHANVHNIQKNQEIVFVEGLGDKWLDQLVPLILNE